MRNIFQSFLNDFNLFTQPILRALVFADVQRDQHCWECKEPELASPPSAQDRFSPLLVPIKCVLYSTCIQDFTLGYHLAHLISHIFWLLQTSICLFALVSGVMGVMLSKFLPEGRAQRRTLEEVTPPHAQRFSC